MDGTRSHRQDLINNIRVGTRCALFRRTGLDALVVSVEQLVLLILFEAALVFVGGLLLALPNPEFSPYGVPVQALGIVLGLLSAVLVARLIGLPERLLTLCVLLFAVSPVLAVVGYGMQAIQEHALPHLAAPAGDAYALLGVLYVVWALAVLLRVFARVQGGYSRRGFVALVLFVTLSQLPLMYFADYDELWYAGDDDEYDAQWAAYRALDAESLLYAQRPRLDKSLAALQPGRPGRTDVYFLGFAGYARENVFRNEVQLAQRIFDDRFGTSTRSLSLINHLDTRDGTPLATSHNLRLALLRLGEIMNRDEDILVLFLTSHGSRRHELSVDFWPLPLNDLTPDMLKGYLDEAGIRWRAVFVSSCYSGGFVPPLRDDYSLVATAAAKDRTSFGCGRDRELTYFGEAFLRDRLTHSYSMVSSLQAAMKAIGTREVKEKRRPSQPQLYIGEAMDAKLRELESTLAPAGCAPRLVEC